MDGALTGVFCSPALGLAHLPAPGFCLTLGASPAVRSDRNSGIRGGPVQRRGAPPGRGQGPGSGSGGSQGSPRRGCRCRTVLPSWLWWWSFPSLQLSCQSLSSGLLRPRLLFADSGSAPGQFPAGGLRRLRLQLFTWDPFRWDPVAGDGRSFPPRRPFAGLFAGPFRLVRFVFPVFVFRFPVLSPPVAHGGGSQPGLERKQ